MKKLMLNLYSFLFARAFFYRFNKLIYFLSLKGLGILNHESNKMSGEEYFIKKYVAKIGKGIVLDVGANIGNYSKSIRKSNKDIDIYAFEPHPVTFQKLSINTSNLGIKTFNVGIGRKTGMLYLYDYANNDGSSHASLYKDVIENIHKSEAVKHEIDIIDLDSFAEKNSIEQIDLLKIDTEGHELEVLKGFEQHIKANKVKLIHFEFNEMNIASKVFFKDFWDILPNYDFYRMLPDGLVLIKHYSPVFCEIFAYQNIVAILKNK